MLPPVIVGNAAFSFLVTTSNTFGVGYVKAGFTGAEGSVVPAGAAFRLGAPVVRFYSDIDRDFVVTIPGTSIPFSWFYAAIVQGTTTPYSVFKTSDAIVTNVTISGTPCTNWKWGSGSSRAWNTVDDVGVVRQVILI